MRITVKLKDIIDALEEAGDSVKHHLDKRTGKVEIITDDITAGMNLENELQATLRDPSRVSLSNKSAMFYFVLVIVNLWIDCLLQSNDPAKSGTN